MFLENFLKEKVQILQYLYISFSKGILFIPAEFRERFSNEKKRKIIESVSEILNKMNIKNEIINDSNELIKFKVNENDLKNYFKKKYKEAKEKWIIEKFSVNVYGDCEEKEAKFDIERLYFETEEEAIINYWNLVNFNFKFNYDKKTIVLSPKKIKLPNFDELYDLK